MTSLRHPTLARGLVLGVVAALGLGAALRGLEGARGSAGEPVARSHPAPWALASTVDGGGVYVACGPRQEVVLVDVEGQRVVWTTRLEGTPRGIAVAPDGTSLAVTMAPEDQVVFVEAKTGRVRDAVGLGRAPEGLAFSRDGALLLVALRWSQEVAVLDVATRRLVTRLPAGAEPFAVARAPGADRFAVVSRRVTPAAPTQVPASEVTLVELDPPRVVGRVLLPSCHLAEGAAFTVDGARVLVPVLRTRNLLPILQVARGWVMSAVLASLDVKTFELALLPLTGLDEGFADPAGIAVMPDGRHAWVASAGSDRLACLDLEAARRLEPVTRPQAPERLSLTRQLIVRRVPLGDNPRGVVRLGRGTEAVLAVSERLDDSVVLLDADGSIRGRIRLAPTLEDDAVHRGQRAFTAAEYCFQDAFSCASCHPEAHTDGLTYDFEVDGVGKHAVLNRSLLGLAGTAPFKWTGTNPTIEYQCGPRFAMVLTRAEPFPEAALADLAAYLESLPPPEPLVDAERADESTRAAIERGRRVFERLRRADGTRLRPSERCVTCHPPPHYTNRQRTDVGTRAPGDPTGAFDVPHLTGIGQKAPYLHDGRATTLEEIWSAPGVGDRHGAVRDLTPAEMADLMLFLRSL